VGGAHLDPMRFGLLLSFENADLENGAKNKRITEETIAIFFD